MSLALSGADAGHLAAAAVLTNALGFERAVRGAASSPGSSHVTLYLHCGSRGGAGDGRTGGPWPAQGVPR
jgi:hypothetical protein